MITPIVFGGNSNPLLVREICKELGVEQGKALVTKFSDTEERIEILENVRRREVFVVQSTSCPAAGNLMELCLMISALKQASASRITAVIPMPDKIVYRKISVRR
jgi:ribose-phosphate pyrophosphokinase